MKNVKMSILFAAVLVSAGAAYATKLPKECTPNYYWDASGVHPIGDLQKGQDYNCVANPFVTCTSEDENGTVVCDTGDFTPIPKSVSK